MKSQLMHIELKTHQEWHNDRSPAWIGWVIFINSGKTLLYRGKRFQKGGRACALIMSMLMQGKANGFPGLKRMEKIVIPGQRAHQLILMRMLDRNTGLKSEISLKGRMKRPPGIDHR